jgi:LacI family transcriptional regulator
MRQVATLAGVSTTTVSRVVNGEEVDADMAARVRNAIDLLGYQRDLTASTLRRADRQSATIGLVLEDVSNPFFSALYRAVEDTARDRGVLLFGASSDEDPDRERELVDGLVSRGVDGLIIAPTTGDHSYLHRESSRGLALTFVDRPPRYVEADTVVSDNYGGACSAVEHLVAVGHRRIAFLGDRPGVHTAAERLRGYRDVLARHGLRERESIVRQPLLDSSMAYEATRALLQGPDPPTAIFSSQNLITTGAVLAIHELGAAQDVALVGFDDVALAQALVPPVTVVAQDPVALGRHAALMLFSRLDGHAGPPRNVVLPTDLIVRGSGELREPRRDG